MGNQCGSCSGAPEEGEILMKVFIIRSFNNFDDSQTKMYPNHTVDLIHHNNHTPIWRIKLSRSNHISEGAKSENKSRAASTTEVSID
jgi:hypothetical protein